TTFSTRPSTAMAMNIHMAMENPTAARRPRMRLDRLAGRGSLSPWGGSITPPFTPPRPGRPLPGQDLARVRALTAKGPRPGPPRKAHGRGALPSGRLGRDDRHQLHVEHQGRVRRYAQPLDRLRGAGRRRERPPGAIGQVRRDGDPPAVADPHQ